MSPHLNSPFECIEPPVGEQLWRLERPETEASLRAELEAHVEACQACQQLLELDARARDLARRHMLGNVKAGRRFWVRLREWLRPPLLAGAALAVAVLTALSLPPRPVSPGDGLRGAEGARFLRPVEGEVLPSGPRTLRWTPVDGATRYRVEIRDDRDERVWRGESGEPSLSLPGGLSLARGAQYRALLATQPADLLPPGGASVAFRVDSPWRAAMHRLRRANPAVQGLGLAAAGLLLVLGFRRLFA